MPFLDRRLAPSAVDTKPDPMSNKATIKAVLYKWKTYSNGEHPLCVRITKDRKQRYRSISGETCHPKYWSKKKNEPLPKCPKKEHLDRMIKRAVDKYEEAQRRLLEEGREITTDRIIQKAEKPLEKGTVLEFYDKIAEELEAKGKTSNAKHYRDIKRQFANFLANKKKGDPIFPDIDFSFLQEWETYLRQRDTKDTTLFAYFKNLRALYREAINRGAAKERDYPFKEFKLSKFSRETVKRAIKEEDVRTIEGLDLSDADPSMIEAQKFALFSFYAAGMNLTDMAYLRWGDIVEGVDQRGEPQTYLQYRRKKTAKFLKPPLLDEARKIIDYFRPVTEGSTYVFPILDPEKHRTETQRMNRIQKVRTRTNGALKEIAKRAGIEDRITMYTFRHSSASILYRKGVPVSFIRVLLGHKTEQETWGYIEELEASAVVDEFKKIANDE